MIQKTLTLIDFIIRHIHYMFWSLCLFLLVFYHFLHLPLDILHNFNLLPQFIFDWANLLAPNTTEVVVSQINTTQIEQELTKLNVQLQNINQNIILLVNKQQIINIPDYSQQFINLSELQKNLNNNIVALLNDTNNLLKTDIQTTLTLGRATNNTLKESHQLLMNLTSLNNNINNILVHTDLVKPLTIINTSLSKLINQQENVQSTLLQLESLNINGFNSIHLLQDNYFIELKNQIAENVDKIQELRNHNSSLFSNLIKQNEIQLTTFEDNIVSSLTEIINQKIVYNTKVNTNQNWLPDFWNTK